MRPLLCLLTALSATATMAQLGDAHTRFTRADTLRGSIGPHRAWWDVVHYDVSVRPDFNTRTITGRTVIAFDAVSDGQRMQIDLQQPLVVDSITTEVSVFRDGAIAVEDRAIAFEHEENVVWVDLPQAMKAGEATTLTIHYHGEPKAARSPPWDGGWIWRKDAHGNPWMTVACQGLGASVWYPCKDHQSDEPQRGAALRITVPDTLQGIGNGRLSSAIKNTDGSTTWNWTVKSPINTYNLVPYIGRYTSYGEPYQGLEGELSCEFWSLEGDAERAREQFKQVPPMLKCFEEWLGPYPFYADGYKLVQAPHLGMEHQSAIAYGNGFVNGYRGMDLSGTGHGLQWDYIIIHESGHEWFGNSITTADIADMWVHEGFTDYTETIFTECQQGKEAAQEYLIGLRKNIKNDRPIIGPYGVNEEGSGDMYYKGANLIHMIRHIVGDSTFKAMLLEMNRRFYHSVVTSAEVEDFMINFNSTTKALLNKSIFDQYLRTNKVPVLEYCFFKGGLWARWSNSVDGFRMCAGFRRGEKTRVEKVDLDFRRVISAAKPKGRFEVAVDENWYVLPVRVSKRTLKSQISMQRKRIANVKP